MPAGTPISLRLFGHKADEARVQREYNNMPNKDDQAAVDTIWTNATQSELIFRGQVDWSVANQQPLNRIIDPLKKTQPRWGTPLLRTMVEAKDDFPADYDGPRTLLVLTDGADTTYPKATRVEKVKSLLRNHFPDQKHPISIQMVLFRVSKEESADAKAQFKDDIEEKFQPPGRVWEVIENSKLSEMIDLALRPKLRLVDLAAGRPTAWPAAAYRPIGRPIVCLASAGGGVLNRSFTPGPCSRPTSASSLKAAIG